MIFVIASLTLKPGMRDEFADKARTAVIAPTREEAGCIFYDLNKSTTDDNLAVFVERWESREALAAHLDSAHMRAWRPISNPMIVSRVVEIVHPADVETL